MLLLQHTLLILALLLCAVIISSYTPTRHTATRLLCRSTGISVSRRDASRKSMFDPDEDEEGQFKRVVTSYLSNKYKDCKTGVEGSLECRFLCDPVQIAEILRTLLPPVTKDELQKEMDMTMESFKGLQTVDEEVFYNAIIENSYWRQAGALVVKELIFLDSLYAYYHKKQMFLGDDEYNELKSMITWEGSSIANLRGDEALFITAIAAQLRGTPIISDDEYDKLKTDLLSRKSWVVQRQQDSLEKLGLNTFIGYLHRSL